MDIQEVFIKACRNGQTEVVKALLADTIETFSAHPAHWAGCAEITRLNPAARDNAAIRLASFEGHAEVVRALLADPRVNPATHDNLAIRWASSGYGYAEVVRALLADPRVNPAAKNNDAIRLASLKGHAEVVRALLADPRVDGTNAIPRSTATCARILASDARCGIEINYSLFAQYHPQITQEYDAILDQCYTMAWLAKQVVAWSDMVEPMAKRLKLSF